jgi:hypothetical protein
MELRRALQGCCHYLIQDPYHEYGMRFVEQIYRQYGHRAIVFYTNRRERLAQGSNAPKLRSECVAAAYNVPAGTMPRFVDALRAHPNIIGVIPFNETSLLPAAELASRLGLSWSPPDVIRRFRDKFLLKDHLRKTAPAVRINASQMVLTTADVLALRRQEPYRRFILKPNDGFGNRRIGLFDRGSTAAEIQTHLNRLAGGPVVMEEYIGGAEYFVNGQIDAGGQVATCAIFRYVRRSANGRHNLDWECKKVSHGSGIFARLADYCDSVMRATQLRRSPFHLELKVDERGPSLIEVAARLAGHGNALLCGELHGPKLDLIELASHHYLNAADFGLLPLDWAAYDARAVRYVHGIAARRERLYDLNGIAAVEALPEFCGWITKPKIGVRIERTVDTLTMPWSVLLQARTELQVSAAADQVRSLIRWNVHTGRGMRVALGVRYIVPRGFARLRQTFGMALPSLHEHISR